MSVALSVPHSVSFANARALQERHRVRRVDRRLRGHAAERLDAVARVPRGIGREIRDQHPRQVAVARVAEQLRLRDGPRRTPRTGSRRPGSRRGAWAAAEAGAGSGPSAPSRWGQPAAVTITRDVVQLKPALLVSIVAMFSAW